MNNSLLTSILESQWNYQTTGTLHCSGVYPRTPPFHCDHLVYQVVQQAVWYWMDQLHHCCQNNWFIFCELKNIWRKTDLPNSAWNPVDASQCLSGLGWVKLKKSSKEPSRGGRASVLIVDEAVTSINGALNNPSTIRSIAYRLPAAVWQPIAAKTCSFARLVASVEELASVVTTIRSST